MRKLISFLLFFFPIWFCFGSDDPIAELKKLPTNPELKVFARGNYSFKPSKGLVQAESFEIAISEGQMMLDSNLSRLGKTQGRVLKAKNSSYLFALTRGGKGADSVVLIEPMSSPRASELIDSELNSSSPMKLLLAGSRIGNFMLSSFVRSPRFHLQDLKVLDSGLWRVEFTYDFDDSEAFPFGYERSYFICDPSNNFFISEGEYNAVEGAKRSLTQYKELFTPGISSGGVTLTRTIHRTVRDSGRSDTLTGTIETSPEVDPRVFHLSFYGFPEPKLNAGYGVWILVAVALIVGIVWFFVRRRVRSLS